MPNLMDRRTTTQQRNREEVTTYSPQSVLHAMDKFQTAVGAMENSVLVPCRLQDIPDPVTGDLYAAYKLLARTKVDLLYGDENSQSPDSKGLRRPTYTFIQPDNGQDKEAAENSTLDPTMVMLHAKLNQNLKNLHSILAQMTESANRVTNLYLNEVGDR